MEVAGGVIATLGDGNFGVGVELSVGEVEASACGAKKCGGSDVKVG